MRLPGATFRHQERIDAPGFTDQRHVRCDTFGNRFEESDIGRAGQVPILGISHHEIKNVLGRGQHDYSGVPRLGLNPHNLILGLDDPQHRTGVLSQQRHRQGQDRRNQKWNDFQHLNYLRLDKCSRACSKPCSSTAAARLAASTGDEV